MDVLSSACWNQLVQSENKAKKIWNQKYGAMYPDVDEEEGKSRPATNQSVRSRSQAPSQPPSRGGSRPGTGRSQASSAAGDSDEKRSKLLQLRTKLLTALEEVDCELTSTQELRAKSRASSSKSRQAK
eukprot:TRINITY_DN3987_c0_g1_i4.p2 TRINITY_DN3987_c0_g1~~TRINITY_DN3987_c0_g1_i4.p2  ORF type:complete len:128 (-),score=25.82 TRINITY_DN3987_c0_g1_i4:420-803(-)